MRTEGDEEFEDADGVLMEDGEPVSVEDRARAMGWKPKAVFRGDPRRWTDAEEFIAHGEAELPILRDNNKRMAEKLARMEPELGELRNTVAEQAQAVKDAMKLAQRADERGYQRGIAELKAKQREAVALGDMEAYDQTEAQIQAAERERAVVEAPEPAAKILAEPPAPAQETVSFVAANPWMNTNATLRTAMINAHQLIMMQHPNMPLAKQYETARSEIVARFPDYFPDEQRQPEVDEEDDEPVRPRRIRQAGVIEPSPPVPLRRRGGSPFDRIENPEERKEAREAYDRLKRLDSTDMSEEDYVSLYLDPHQDTLAMRAARKRA